jgi:hypothetical protein
MGTVSAVAVAALLWAWYWNARDNDFGHEAARSFHALLHGHLATFLSNAPAYGASLILRAPFALPASLAHAGPLTIYRLSALPCLLTLAALGVWLARHQRLRGGGVLAAAAILAVCVANPITYRALQLGHPEELLGAALCTVAVLLAQRGRAGWAAVALGLAVANKEWALMAVGPVLLAAPAADRRQIVLIATAVAGALLAPIILGSGTLQTGASRVVVSSSGTIFRPQQLFWFLGHNALSPHVNGIHVPSFRLPPAWLGGRIHMIIVALAFPLSWFAARRGASRADALLLLALLMLIRCALDPWDVMYYLAPFVVALLAWEITTGRLRPLYSVAATAVVWVVFWYLPRHTSADAQAVAFLIPSTLAIAFMAARLYSVVPRGRQAVSRLPALTRVPAAPS